MSKAIIRKPFAGPTRRLFAYVIDLITLNISSFVLYQIFKAISIIQIEFWQLFFIIFCFYFGILDSIFLNGKSAGKKLLNIIIVDSSGQPISFTKAFIRALLVAVIYFHNEFKEIIFNLLSNHIPNLMISIIILFIFSVLISGTTIFMIFNPYYQGIHDVIFGSFVVIKGTFETEDINKHSNYSRIVAAYFLSILFIVLSIVCFLLYKVFFATH